MKKSLALVVVWTSLLVANAIFAQDSKTNTAPTQSEMQANPISGGHDQNGYTINFDNVPILEFMKFISKIANVNFVYEPNELNFNISVVSDQEASLQNVMAAFVQVLKINGFNLIEDGNNLVISQNAGIKQIPTIVTDNLPYMGDHFPAYVTRVFHLNNANPARVVEILRPMISEGALLEVVESSRQVIISDITSNVNQIAKLVATLDQPQSAMQVYSFKVKNNSATSVKPLAEQILMPIAGEQPVILVPQESSNTLFIVSTPFLINQAIDVLSELDHTPIPKRVKNLTGENIYVYKIKYRSEAFIESSLQKIGANAEKLGFSTDGLYETIANMKYMKTTNSLLFIGNATAIDQIKTLLDQIDVPGKPNANNEHAKFFMYHPENTSPAKLKETLLQIAKNMQASGLSDQTLISTIESAKVVDSTQSLLFTGDADSISAIKGLLQDIDSVQKANKSNQPNKFFMYHPLHVSPAHLKELLSEIATNMEKSGVQSTQLIEAIQSAKVVSSSNTVLFTANESTISQIKDLLPEIDTIKNEMKKKAPKKFFMYHPKHESAEEIKTALEQITKNMRSSGFENTALTEVINQAKIISSTKSILFTGTEVTIDEVKTLLSEVDIPQEQAPQKQPLEFFVYHPSNSTPEQIKNFLQEVAKSAHSSGFKQKALLDTIEQAKIIQSTNSLLFTGTKESIEKIKTLLSNADLPTKEISPSGPSQFFMFHPKHESPEQIQTSLEQIAKNMSASGLSNTQLINTIKNARIIDSTKSILFTGSADSIAEIKSLLPEVDLPSKENPKTSEFFMFHPKHESPEQIQTSLEQIAKNMSASGLSNTQLINTIKNARIVDSTKSILFTGSADSIAEIKSLLPEVDLPGKEKPKTSEFFMFHPEHESPEQVKTSLEQIAKNMSASGLTNAALISTIQNARIVDSTKSILFTGSAETIAQVKLLVGEVDRMQKGPTKKQPSQFFMYKPQHESPQDIQSALEEIAKNMSASGLNNNALIAAIQNAKIVDSTKSILFTGSDQSIKEIKSLLPSVDVPPKVKKTQTGPSEFFMYHPKSNTPDEIKAALEQVAKNMSASGLSNTALISTIQNARIVDKTNAVLFTGSAETIAEVKLLLNEIDVQQAPQAKPGPSQFFMYKPQHESPQDIQSALEEIAKNMSASGLNNNALIAAIQNAKIVDSTKSILFTGSDQSIKEIKSLLPSVDVPPKVKKTQTGPSEFFMYHPKTDTPDEIKAALEQVAKNMSASGLSNTALISTIQNARVVDKTNSVLFTGSAETIAEVKLLLSEIDVQQPPQVKPEPSKFFMYHPENASPEQLQSILVEISKNMKSSGVSDKPLIKMIDNAKVIDSTNSILFTGPEQAIIELKAMLKQVDADTKDFKNKASSFYIYKIQNATHEQMAKSLDGFIENLKNSKSPNVALINAIKSMKYIKGNNSLIFTGNPESITQLEKVLPEFDVSQGESAAEKMAESKSDFFMYTPKHVEPEILLNSIEDVAKKLSNSGLSNGAFILTLESAKYIPSSHAIVFTGNPESIKRVQNLLTILDQPKEQQSQSKIFIYTPKNVSEKVARESLDNFAQTLPSNDPTRTTILQAKWLDYSHSFVFQGPQSAIEKIQQILGVTDVEKKQPVAQTYYIYKLKEVPGDLVIKDLKQMVHNLQLPPSQKQGLVSAIDNIEWVKSTNSLFITGAKNDVDQVKALVEQLDQSTQKDKEEVTPSTTFMIYKPENVSPKNLDLALKSLGEDLEDSGLSDKDLLTTINTARVSESTNSLVFTGTQKNLDKIKQLLQTIDVPKKEDTSIHQVGMSTFLIYKIKHRSSQYLMETIESMAQDMKNAPGGDKQFIQAVETMRYVKETNSLIFTGQEKALEKIRSILARFDESTAQPTLEPTKQKLPTDYLLYSPKNVPGNELIATLQEFEQNLKASGVTDPALYSVINNLKWMEKTNSILVSGEKPDAEKVLELLQKFDVPQKGKKKPVNIETIEDVSFLMYKLQYHKGDEIQAALKQVAVDLKKVKDAKINQNLVNAIQSLQWIQITNSLIASGEPRTLEKLRELLLSIDVPLSQVFIEVLVLKTTLGKKLDFGLRWGSQGTYKGKFGYGFGNFPSQSGVDQTFAENLGKISATTKPTGSDVPFVTGGDLGIIGDIITHKGKSYFALGSLVNALQQDGNASVIINQKIVAQDSKTAKLFVGSNIPFSGSTVKIVGQTQTTSSNLEYRDIGTSLDIVPRIGEDDAVTLEINLEISSNNQDSSDITDSTIPDTQLNSLITRKTNIDTRVNVPNNHFLAISGMIKDTNLQDKVGIPCLGGLPVVGAAFSNNQNTQQKDNVILFIKPTIIKSNDVYKNITEKQEELFRSQANEEVFDQGIDLVASPDDE